MKSTNRPRPASPHSLARLLLRWYDRHRRDLPWRALPGKSPDPYAVWLSEIMLQQTTVATVGPYYRAFLARWPTLARLAAASQDEVLRAWAGLGYYGRARNFHRAAGEVMARLGGRIPCEEAELRRLPGIGAYTAAAVAAIAFGKRTTPVDGNVERVMARYFGVETKLPAAKPELRRLAQGLTPARRPGDYAQGVMDLGATICLPRNPRCGQCPWRRGCVARARGMTGSLPARLPKRPRPLRHGVVYWILAPDGAVLLRRRPENGLLGGLMEFPTTAWRAEPWSAGEARGLAPVAARWRELPGAVRHGFTHFELALTVLVGRARRRSERTGVWSPVDRLNDHALPTVMKKVARHAQEGGVSRRRSRP